MKTIIQLSDSHILNKGLVKGVDSFARLEQIIAVLPKNDGIIITGDLTHNGDHASYKRFEKVIKKITSPVFVMSGNHDNPNKTKQILGEYQQDLDLGKWKIIAIDTVQKNKISGRVDELNFDIDKDCFYLIAIHHPPISMESDWDDDWSLENPRILFTEVKKHPEVKAVIWGHAHEEKHSKYDGVELLSCPSTAFSFRDTKKFGFRQIQLNDDGTIITKVVWMK